MGIDYKYEVQELQKFEARDWFKPIAGQYNIKILEEPEKIEKDFEGEIRKQLRLSIETQGNAYFWDFSVGMTTNSLYGQLMLLGASYGSLKGKQMTLVVKRARDKNDYTILEAIPLMKPKEEKVEE